MNILFIHQNFPGQFRHIAPEMVRRGHIVKALMRGDGQSVDMQGVNVSSYKISRSTSETVHPWVSDFETKIIRAESCFKAALNLKNEGFVPDVIMAHPGWGESLFIKDVWPSAKLGIYCEFFYSADTTDVGFDPEFPVVNKDLDSCRIKIKNINNLMHFDVADFGLSPTAWQASTFPNTFQNKISVIHDGIDTKVVKPNSNSNIIIKSNDETLKISRGDQIVTFVNRNLEPYRGYHVFCRSLPQLLKKYPKLRILIIGGSNVSYGSKPDVQKFGRRSWRDIFAAEVKPQMSASEWRRIHFMGNVSYQIYLKVLQLSQAHVYLTYPFVLSWSLLEAMAAACPIIASDTGPLRGIIEQEKNGLLVNFFSIDELVGGVGRLLENPEIALRLGNTARRDCIKKFDLHSVCLPAQIKLLETNSSV